MNSLVTGCAGFIGSHLVEKLLSMGHSVLGLDCFLDYYPRELKEKNMQSFLKDKRFKFIEGNILNLDLKEILNDIDYIFHQAAQAGVRNSWGESFQLYTQNNILATQELLEACRNSNVKKVIYASSSSVYGDAKEMPMKETSLPQPISPYGVSKLAGEHLSRLYWKIYEIPTMVLRYFSVYGPRQRPDMAFHKFTKAILSEEKIQIYGNGEQTRDFTYVDDIIGANILAINSGLEGEIYNIGGGSRTTVNECIKILEEITGKKADLEYIEDQKGDMRHTYADTTKAEKELGYKPRISLRQGLEKEVTWIKENGILVIKPIDKR